MQRTAVLWYAGFCALVAIGFAVRPWLAGRSMRSRPQTLDAAIAVADAQGLYHNTDQYRSGPVSRLVVSDWEVTRERACGVHVNDPNHACLMGTVAVYYPAQRMVANYDPQHSVIWGNLFVYGDPTLIEQLTGIHLEAYN